MTRQVRSGALLDAFFAAVTTAGATWMLHMTLRAMDPNRTTREEAAKRKKEIAKKLGRPNISLNAYEDVIACDVANPSEISTTFDSIGGLGETKQALQEIVILPLLRPELFASGEAVGGIKRKEGGKEDKRMISGFPNAIPALSVTSLNPRVNTATTRTRARLHFPSPHIFHQSQPYLPAPPKLSLRSPRVVVSIPPFENIPLLSSALALPFPLHLPVSVGV